MYVLVLVKGNLIYSIFILFLTLIYLANLRQICTDLRQLILKQKKWKIVTMVCSVIEFNQP